jgi:hypothetical protein
MNMNEIIEDKFDYDSFTGTYWVYCDEVQEHIEVTEDELIQEGIYLNEFCQRV